MAGGELSVPPAATPVGIFYCWWRGDPLPRLRPDPGYTIEIVDETGPVPALASTNAAPQLLGQHHRLYLARTGDDIIGHGWCATRTASIGELGVELVLPARNRYLWGFVTRPEWRGRGVYPGLLQAMLHDEDADRFWIGHDAGNDASARGIIKAGFSPLGPVYARPDGRLVFAPPRVTERALACEKLFGIPFVLR
jgi:hypothetical protein